MVVKPTLIKQASPHEVLMRWNDGHESMFTTEYLRRSCPCASCMHEKEENARNRMLSLPLASQTELRRMEPSGHNAVVITWGDGHKTGIYTWEYLRQICPCGKCTGGVQT